MRKTDFQIKSGIALATVAILLSSACSVNVQKKENGQDKQVDIKTPMGSVHISKGVDAQDVGVVVYPGARLKQDGDESDRSANVSVSGFGYGVKVAALEYESSDAPDKIIAFYQDQLKKYGNVLVCHTGHFHVNTDLENDKHSNSHELACEGSNGVDVELKVGTKENQHIVAIEPEGSGSKFSLVSVRTHSKQADI
jgi:hypothetical protein